MGKIAWLVTNWEDDDEFDAPHIIFGEPRVLQYKTIIKIVYFEVEL